jgi:hypothetical protein
MFRRIRYSAELLVRAVMKAQMVVWAIGLSPDSAELRHSPSMHLSGTHWVAADAF